MKYIFKTFILLMFVSLVSCDTSLEDVNIDPNTSPTANDAQILTGAMGFLGYIVDVDLNSGSFLWGQYYTWGTGVSIGNAERFVAQPDDYNGYWQRAYANSLTDLNFLAKSESAAYKGVAGVLEAYIYQGLVDHFGPIPYSEAIKGEIADGSILTPKYDDAASVYAALVVKIDEAIANIGKAEDGDIGADDLIYGGDLSKWMKFANSLKLRILMRTSELGDANAAAIQALVQGNNFISSMDEIPAIPFNGGSGDQNPMFARFTWGVGDFYYASNGTLNVLADLGDPRVGAFYRLASTGDNADTYYGIDQGSIDDELFTATATDYSQSSPIAFGETNSVILMSDWESWFLRSEADARYGTADDAEAAFAKAIVNNFTYLGIDGGSAYADGLGYASAANLDEELDLIAVQKWISMNGTQEDEGWVESRRFDRPNSRLFTDGIYQTPPKSILGDGVFPSTWLYPATERSLNSNAPAQRAITDKIFWDN